MRQCRSRDLDGASLPYRSLWHIENRRSAQCSLAVDVVAPANYHDVAFGNERPAGSKPRQRRIPSASGKAGAIPATEPVTDSSGVLKSLWASM